MATKINPLDFGRVTNVEIKTLPSDVISIEITISIIPESGEDLQIIKEALTDSIRNK